MGEVYRARDTKLGRDVALKVLPEAFVHDAMRMTRFEREAKLLASLNQPNIAAIYGLEESNADRALVMELVEGPTLSERIKQGPFSFEDAMPIARQMAEALEYAHERGIVHRDLKPSNVKLTADGQVKLLDFGLAKALEGETSEEELQNSPTLSAAATRAGVMLGTAAYMAPEQARGKRVDRRADIWAFGCLLYEMLTGRSTFSGETTSDILAGVIRAEPEWSSLPGSVPPRIRELLRRCLQKDAKQRLQAIGEARIVIERVVAGTPEEVVSPTAAATEAQPRWHRALPWSVATIATLFGIGVSALYWRGNQPETHAVMQFSLPLSQPLAGVFSPNPGSPFAISPDGSQIAFVSSVAGKPAQLYLLRLDQRSATPLASTENASQPFFSPDGQWVGFFAQGKLRKVSLHGGPATVFSDAPVPHGASWAGDAIIYAPNFGSGLMRISSAGGVPQTLTTPNTKEQEVSHRWPQVLPGGKAVLFTIQMDNTVSYDDARIAVLSLETGKWRKLIDGGFYARYVPSGHLVYAHAGSLMAVRFDLQRFEVNGAATPIQEGVATSASTSGGAEYDVTSSGLLAYVPGTAKPPERSLFWVDRNGLAKSIPATPKFYSNPRLSPDGKLLAIQVADVGPPDIWVYDFARNTLTRLTFGPGINTTPVWSPDGRRIVYRTRASFSFRSKLADGSGKDEVLLSQFDDPGAIPYTVSPDGKTLLFGARNSAGIWGLQGLSLDGTGKVQSFLGSPPFFDSRSGVFTPQFSPDGRWFAYVNTESGRQEVYVQPSPGPGGKYQVSTEGGTYPRWARSGREIFYFDRDRLMSVAVETQPAFRAATPRMLFRATGYVDAGTGGYDVAPDGQHFLMLKQEETEASPAELNVTLNWFDELKRRAPLVRR